MLIVDERRIAKAIPPQPAGRIVRVHRKPEGARPVRAALCHPRARRFPTAYKRNCGRPASAWTIRIEELGAGTFCTPVSIATSRL